MTTLLVTGAAGFIGSNFTANGDPPTSPTPVGALDALTYAGVQEKPG